MRRNDKRYIRFKLDGSVEGEYDGIAIKGTYEYVSSPHALEYWIDFGDIKIIPEAGAVWTGGFLLLSRVNFFTLYGNSFLEFGADVPTNFKFIRGIDEN